MADPKARVLCTCSVGVVHDGTGRGGGGGEARKCNVFFIVKMVLCQAENELLASLHIEQHSRTCMC